MHPTLNLEPSGLCISWVYQECSVEHFKPWPPPDPKTLAAPSAAPPTAQDSTKVCYRELLDAMCAWPQGAGYVRAL